MNKIKTYKEFVETIESMGLKLNDLEKYGCMSRAGLKNFINHFRQFPDSKDEWKKFKKDDAGYYSIVIMGPDVAMKNKKESQN